VPTWLHHHTTTQSPLQVHGLEESSSGAGLPQPQLNDGNASEVSALLAEILAGHAKAAEALEAAASSNGATSSSSASSGGGGHHHYESSGRRSSGGSSNGSAATAAAAAAADALRDPVAKLLHLVHLRSDGSGSGGGSGGGGSISAGRGEGGGGGGSGSGSGGGGGGGGGCSSEATNANDNHSPGGSLRDLPASLRPPSLILGPDASPASNSSNSSSSMMKGGNGATSSSHPGMTPTSAFLATYEREARAQERQEEVSSRGVGVGGVSRRAEEEEIHPRRMEVPRVAEVPKVEWTMPSPRVRPPPPTAPLPTSSANPFTIGANTATSGTDMDLSTTSSSSSERALAWASAQVRAAVRQCRAATAATASGAGDPPVEQLLPLFPYLSTEAQKSVMRQLVLQYKLSHAQMDSNSHGPPFVNTRSSGQTPKGNHRSGAGSSSKSANGGRSTSSKHRAISPNRSLSSTYAPSPRMRQAPLVPPWGSIASSNGYGADSGSMFHNMGNNSSHHNYHNGSGSGAGTPLHAAAAAVEPFEMRSSADVAKLFKSSEDMYAMNDAELAKLWAISPTAASSSSSAAAAATPTTAHFNVPPPPTTSYGNGSNHSSSSSSTRGSSHRSRHMLPPPPTSNYSGAVPSPSSRSSSVAVAAPPTLARVQARAAAAAAAEGGGGGGSGRGFGNGAMTTPRGGSGRMGSDRDSESVATFNSDDMLASLGDNEDIWGSDFA